MWKNQDRWLHITLVISLVFLQKFVDLSFIFLEGSYLWVSRIIFLCNHVIRKYSFPIAKPNESQEIKEHELIALLPRDVHHEYRVFPAIVVFRDMTVKKN